MALQQGSVVWLTVVDPAGRNPKLRPAVVLTRTSEIVEGGQVVVACATTRIDHPLPENHIKLPWNANGSAKTGLRKPCVVVCDWLYVADLAGIEQIGGVVPATVLHEILARLPSIEASPTAEGKKLSEAGGNESVPDAEPPDSAPK